MINTQELRGLLQEAGELSNKTNWTKQDERRNAFLLSAISAVKEGAASAIGRIGTYSGVGEFVPTEFFPELFRALAWYDVLFDEATCTVIKTTNGRPMTVPVAGDVEVVASVL